MASPSSSFSSSPVLQSLPRQSSNANHFLPSFSLILTQFVKSSSATDWIRCSPVFSIASPLLNCTALQLQLQLQLHNIKWQWIKSTGLSLPNYSTEVSPSGALYNRYRPAAFLCNNEETKQQQQQQPIITAHLYVFFVNCPSNILSHCSSSRRQTD